MARTKQIPPQMKEHFRQTLRRWVDKNFEGNETKAAVHMDVNQSHMNAILNRDSGRGPGLPFLLAFREVTGMSLDEMLGLGPANPDQLFERLRLMLQTENAKEKRDAKLLREEAQGVMAEAQRMMAEARALLGRIDRGRAVEDERSKASPKTRRAR